MLKSKGSSKSTKKFTCFYNSHKTAENLVQCSPALFFTYNSYSYIVQEQTVLKENLIYIVIIALIGAIALTISYIITRREQKAQAKSDRLTWLRKQAIHILDGITTLKSAGASAGLLEKLNKQAMVYIEEISLLAPDSDLMTQVNNQKEAAERTPAGQGLFRSDKDLKRLQIYIRFTEKLLTEQVKKGKLTGTLAKSYGQELYWLNIRVVAEAHENQALQLIADGDKLTALSHLKHAKAVVVRAMIPQAKKQPILERLQPQIEEIQPRKIIHAGALEESIDDFLK